MKKLFLCIFNLFLIFSLLFFYNPDIYAEQSYFARIKEDNVYIYTTPENLEDLSNQLFELPKTYFVEVFEKTNDYFYKVRYNDIYGYVKSNQITFVKDIPQTPFNTKMTFRVFVPNGTSLRSLPNTLNGVNSYVITIPFLASSIVYYGNRNGEESVVYKGTTWYYCKYITESAEYFGYVYSAYCDLIVENDINQEIIEEISPPSFDFNNNNNSETPFENMSKSNEVLLISLACLPCIFIVYLLFKPTKTLSKQKSAPKKKIKRLKKSDYFEFDDEFLNN